MCRSKTVCHPITRGGIVARRALRYVPHSGLFLPVTLRLSCKDRPCRSTIDVCGRELQVFDHRESRPLHHSGRLLRGRPGRRYGRARWNPAAAAQQAAVVTLTRARTVGAGPAQVPAEAAGSAWAEAVEAVRAAAAQRAAAAVRRDREAALQREAAIAVRRKLAAAVGLVRAAAGVLAAPATPLPVLRDLQVSTAGPTHPSRTRSPSRVLHRPPTVTRARAMAAKRT